MRPGALESAPCSEGSRSFRDSATYSSLQREYIIHWLVDHFEALPLDGKTFVVTGTLSGFSRSESESRIKDLGGKVTSSVTKNTDYLVVGESPGSKLAAAERLGTEVLDEARFVELLADPPVEADN